MAGLPEPSLGELLAGLAAPTPAPGAGSATGWTCAHAAALVEMTAGITLARPDAQPTRERMVEIAARARALRAASMALAEADLDAYAPVLSTLRVPRGDPSRATRLDAALSAASDTPLELAGVASELAVLAAEVAVDGAAGVHGDACAAVLIAEAACQTAAQLVAINLGRRPDDPRIAEAARHAERASELRARVLERQRH